MYKLRPREERGNTINDWQKSFHSFSFASYFDPFKMGFSDLRVINDTTIEPLGVSRNHSHKNMEIINIILSGEMEQKVFAGKTEILNANDVQVISTGAGILHSEYNISASIPLHFLQIWILPNKKNFEPTSQTKHFSKEKLLNKIKLIVSGTGKECSLKIHQDAAIYRSLLEADKSVFFNLPENRKIWIQVAKGAIEINANILESGDGLSIVNEYGELEITGVEKESDFLIFSLRNLTI